MSDRPKGWRVCQHASTSITLIGVVFVVHCMDCGEQIQPKKLSKPATS